MASLTLLAAGAKAAGTLTTVAKVAALGGTVLSAAGAYRQGQEQKVQAEYQAKVDERNADQATAAGQRRAAAEYRQGKFIRSRQQAIAAASGGGTDASVIDMMTDVENETALNAQTIMSDAKNQSQGYLERANVSRVNGRNAARAGTLGAIGAGISGFSSMYERFGRPNERTSRVTSRYG